MIDKRLFLATGDAQVLRQSSRVNAVHAADIDGDGDIDVLSLDNGLVWYENLDGDGNFLDATPDGVHAFDVAGDRVVGVESGEVRAWEIDPETGQIVPLGETSVGPGFIEGVSVSPDGNIFAVGATSNQIAIGSLDELGPVIESTVDGASRQKGWVWRIF